MVQEETIEVDLHDMILGRPSGGGILMRCEAARRRKRINSLAEEAVCGFLSEGNICPAIPRLWVHMYSHRLPLYQRTTLSTSGTFSNHP